ncbi:MAG TPA: succinyl-diaminopimelate desuccinylase [Acidimicrobiales bacterium]
MATDLLQLTAWLVDIPSVSHHESVIVDAIERELVAFPWLETVRIGDNLVARTNLGRSMRVVLGGHTDTVPPTPDNASARLDGDTLWGVGAADMKGGLAVMLELARTIREPAVDVTYVFYAREEVALEHNGLREIARERPDLLAADAAILGEPTSAVLEAGCQGTMRLQVTLTGTRAHTARAWLGRNAIHRLGRLTALLDAYEPRQPVIQGCQYREALQAVYVDGGVAGNVVPDRASITLNHRFAPDRTIAEAEAHVREVLAPALEPGDHVEVVDAAPAAAPNLQHPLLAVFAGRNDLEVRAKLGWTDVAFFAERGIPAANFGPGNAEISHTADEHIERDYLEYAFAALSDLLRKGV